MQWTCRRGEGSPRRRASSTTFAREKDFLSEYMSVAEGSPSLLVTSWRRASSHDSSLGNKDGRPSQGRTQRRSRHMASFSK